MKSQITIKKIQDLLIKGVQSTYVDEDGTTKKVRQRLSDALTPEADD